MLFFVVKPLFVPAALCATQCYGDEWVSDCVNRGYNESLKYDFGHLLTRIFYSQFQELILIIKESIDDMY